MFTHLIRKSVLISSNVLIEWSFVKLNILFLCNQPKIGQDANTIIDNESEELIIEYAVK